SMSGMPQRRQKTPNTASSAATLKSHHAASSRPPATAWPSTAAITGLPSSMRVGPTGPSPSGATRLARGAPSSRIAFRSAPAQNLPPAPVSTATASASSSSKRRKAATPAALCATSAARATSFGQRSLTLHGGSGEPQELAQHRGLGVEAFKQHGITHPLQASDLGVLGA